MTDYGENRAVQKQACMGQLRGLPTAEEKRGVLVLWGTAGSFMDIEAQCDGWPEL